MPSIAVQIKNTFLDVNEIVVNGRTYPRNSDSNSEGESPEEVESSEGQSSEEEN